MQPRSLSVHAALVSSLLALAACESTATDATSSSSSSSGAGGGGGAKPMAAPDPTGFHTVASLAKARSHHTATLLSDGRVIVIGGENGAGQMLSEVEIFDPVTESWSSGPPLPEPRSNHTATRLADGRVLVTGGGLNSAIGIPSGEGVLASAVVYDPTTNAFSAVGAMADPRAGHLATLLDDGRVLVAGGATHEVGTPCTTIPNCATGKALASAEAFDPATGAFSAVGSMTTPRLASFITTLHDGRPLIAGGADDTDSVTNTDLFDAKTNAFSGTGPLLHDRLYLSGGTLGSGRVLAVAGKNANVSPLKSTELYDPTTGAWAAGPDVGSVRTAAAVVTLQSGNAISIGGYDQLKNKAIGDVELFDDASSTWTILPPITKPRAIATATLLLDGRVLVVGGVGSSALPTVDLSQ